jgi:hypothetical protein
LLPQGWPEEDSEREALTRVLLAAGADIERLLDEPTNSPDAFVRHATRMPFLRYGRECPMVAFAPRNNDADELLAFRSMLLSAVGSLRETTWLVYLSTEVRSSFQRAAIHYGDLYDARGGLLTWHVPPGVLGLVSRDTWVVGLAARLEELLTPCLESGIMPVDTPVAESQPHNAVTTEPAPPSDRDPFQELPYAAVAANAMSPQSRILTPATFSSAPPFRPTSTMPPNPRLRKG